MTGKQSDPVVVDPTALRGELASLDDANAREAASGSSRKAGDATTAGPTELQTVRRSTGKPKSESHRDKYEFVKVFYMKRDFEFDGVVYNGGYDVEIPAPLAAAIGLAGERTAHSTDRTDETEEGLDQAEKHPTSVGDQENRAFNAIPVSDPANELPGHLAKKEDAEGSTPPEGEKPPVKVGAGKGKD